MGGDDPLEQIFYGNPGDDCFRKAQQKYEELSSQKKEALIGRCFKKLSKKKKARQVLAILHLIDRISKVSGRDQLSSLALRFDSLSKPNITQTQKGEKLAAASTHLAKFYYKFLSLKLCRDHTVEISSENCPLNKSLQVAEMSVQMAISMLQVEFILYYFLTYNDQVASKTQNSIGRSVMASVLVQLKFLVNFVKKWSSIILQNHENSVAVNEIYEKVIRIYKDRKKIEALLKKLKVTSSLPEFLLDKEFNRKIQKEMMGKVEQKRAFKTEKNLKSRKLIEANVRFNDDVNEDDILIGYAEF